MVEVCKATKEKWRNDREMKRENSAPSGSLFSSLGGINLREVGKELQYKVNVEIEVWHLLFQKLEKRAHFQNASLYFSSQA